ncbi:short-chain dehydrogenase [Agrococcus baldri]|uniref:Short-chain dehydrogenase n=2 Tax=Agrococcus baldri TaxID=153730 RepID=A0AA87UR48_9MICO|nr:short-chain dehydrogenase [Agrococcus baldri]
MTTKFDFDGQTAIVTGGASGIGAAITRLLIESGATVYVADVDPESAPEGALRAEVDVADWDSMTAFVDDVAAQTGRIDAIFNNAAINAFTDLLDATVDEFERIMRVNARGVFVGMKAVLPSMLRAGRGAIVNTGSTAAVIGIDDRASYSASKGAVVALTRQVAVQYASRGIRANVVHPGTTSSPMLTQVIAAAGDSGATLQRLTTRQPINRMADATEIASAAVYLASDLASYVTGVELTVDGGWTAA